MNRSQIALQGIGITGHLAGAMQRQRGGNMSATYHVEAVVAWMESMQRQRDGFRWPH